MKNAISLTSHRSWEDWLGIALGGALMISPWLTSEGLVGGVVFNAFAIGLMVVVMSIMELFDRRRWEEALQFACGVWMIASPFVFNYAASGQLRFWHFAIGAIVAVLAVLEFNQPSEHAL
jgi:CDP-diglyceride synthetase